MRTHQLWAAPALALALALLIHPSCVHGAPWDAKLVIGVSNGSLQMSCDVDTPIDTQAPPTRLRGGIFVDGSKIYSLPSKPLTNGTSGRISFPVNSPERLVQQYINKNWTCQMLHYAPLPNNKVKILHYRTSQEKFVGIKPQKRELELEEDSTANVSIVSTVPIVCESRAPAACCVTLNLWVSDAAGNLAVGTTCHYELCGSDWDPASQTATTDIPVLATRDDIDDGNIDVFVRFTPLDPSGGGDVHQIWRNVSVSRVLVKVKDAAPGVCTISGDPHVRQFDKRGRYTFFGVGDYVLYENPSQDFEVHGRTHKCGRNMRASCLCALVVREGHDVLEANVCGQGVSRGKRHPRHRQRRHRSNGLTLRVPMGGLKGGTKVYQSRRANRALIDFPSGASISLQRGAAVLNMELTVPPKYLTTSLGQGLCGTYDGNATNDFTDRNNKVLVCRGRNCQPPGFVNSWSLRRNQTMFLNIPKIVAQTLSQSQGRNWREASFLHPMGRYIH